MMVSNDNNDQGLVIRAFFAVRWLTANETENATRLVRILGAIFRLNPTDRASAWPFVSI